MIPLCADEGVGTIIWSPLARGRLARTGDEPTTRSSSTDSAYADLLYTEKQSDQAIIETIAKLASNRGVSRAQIALAWLRRNPVVVAPLIGAGKPAHIKDAVASLEIELTDDEAAALEAPYTARNDWQGVSDPDELARISARFGIRPA